MINETICWSEELDHDGDWVIFPGLLLLKAILINIISDYCCISCKDKFELLYLKCFISLPVFLWTSLLSSLYIIVDPAVPDAAVRAGLLIWRYWLNCDWVDGGCTLSKYSKRASCHQQQQSRKLIELPLHEMRITIVTKSKGQLLKSLTVTLLFITNGSSNHLASFVFHRQ